MITYLPIWRKIHRLFKELPRSILPPKSYFCFVFGTVPGLSTGGVAPGFKLFDALPISNTNIN
jgi:hypothetical protein